MASMIYCTSNLFHFEIHLLHSQFLHILLSTRSPPANITISFKLRNKTQPSDPGCNLMFISSRQENLWFSDNSGGIEMEH